jgi:RNA polymerase sigma-70 factor (ECF subfamily)
MIASEARGAWQDIERRLRPYVTRRVASAADVDDVLQEIFVRIHRGLSGLRDGERFGGWAYRVAQSAIADAGRARARSVLALVDETPEIAAQEADGNDELESELGACVALFVARLPAHYREAVTLTDLEGLTQKDAAEMLGLTLSAMKSRTLRGREKIRSMFEECCRISVDCRGRVTACEPRALEDIPEDCREAAEALMWKPDRAALPGPPEAGTTQPSARSDGE